MPTYFGGCVDRFSGAFLAALLLLLLMLLLWAAEKMDSPQTQLLFEAGVIASPRFFRQPAE